MTHYWRIRKWRGDRHGHDCRLLARGRNGNVLVEFADGERVVTPRWSVRKRANGAPGQMWLLSDLEVAE